MKNLFTSVLLATATICPSWAQNKETRQIDGEFSQIEVTKGANISLIQCDKTELEVVTDGCPTSDVETTVKKGTLIVSMKNRTSGSAVQVFIYFKDVNEIRVKRGASVETECVFAHKGKLKLSIGAQCEAKLDIDVDELEIEGSTCIINLEGTAKTQKVNISGSVGESTYNAQRLKSENIDVKAVYSDVSVYFTNSLTAEALSATIKYKGDSDKVSKTEKSNGVIEPLDAKTTINSFLNR